MLLDIARLLLQKDTREALKELVQLIRRHPEWKKDFVEIAEGFTAPEADKARVLVKFIAEVLAQKGWPSSRTGVVEYGIQELVDNAFTHGSRTATAGTCVRIKAVLTSHWAKCEVSDTGDGFDLDTILRLQKQGEVRGLTTVHGLVRTLTQPSPNSIEVFIDQRPAGVSRYRHQGADVICMKGDFHGSQLLDDLEPSSALDNGGPALIFDLMEAEYLDSRAFRFITLSLKPYARRKALIVLAVAPDSRVREILQIGRYGQMFAVVPTIEEALALVTQHQRGTQTN